MQRLESRLVRKIISKIKWERMAMRALGEEFLHRCSFSGNVARNDLRVTEIVDNVQNILERPQQRAQLAPGSEFYSRLYAKEMHRQAEVAYFLPRLHEMRRDESKVRYTRAEARLEPTRAAANGGRVPNHRDRSSGCHEGRHSEGVLRGGAH